MDGQGRVTYGWTRTGDIWTDKDWWCIDGQGLVTLFLLTVTRQQDGVHGGCDQ